MVRSVTLSAALLLALGTLDSSVQAHQNDGWHFDHMYTLVQEQLDPILWINQQGQHMHRVVGGSSFRAAYNFDLTKNSSCSSVAVQADKSNYWMPRKSHQFFSGATVS